MSTIQEKARQRALTGFEIAMNPFPDQFQKLSC
jgi:hypothetical protein